jgi:ABC-type multidrug transport system fused ATPase/permease subunit
MVIMVEKEKRVELTSELLQGMSLLKMFTWERWAKQRVSMARNAEMENVRKWQIYLALLNVMFMSCGSFLAIFTFVTYSLLGNVLTGDVIFPSLYVLQSIMVWPLINFPYCLSVFMQARVSATRITRFLLLPELECNRPLSGAQQLAKGAVRLQGCSFSWRQFASSTSEEESAPESTATTPSTTTAVSRVPPTHSQSDVELTEVVLGARDSEEGDDSDRPLLERSATARSSTEHTVTTVLHDIDLNVQPGRCGSHLLLVVSSCV